MQEMEVDPDVELVNGHVLSDFFIKPMNTFAVRRIPSLIVGEEIIFNTNQSRIHTRSIWSSLYTFALMDLCWHIIPVLYQYCMENKIMKKELLLT